jgi:predicted MPP superfamily phosphohydrolase
MNPWIFIIVFSTVLGAVHYFAYRRMFVRLHFNPKLTNGLKWFTVVNYIGVLGYSMTRYFISVPDGLYYMLSLSLGMSFVLFFGTLLFELMMLLINQTTPDSKRRKFFKTSADVGIVAAGAGYMGAAINEGSKQPAIESVKIDQPHLKRPYRIVQISDMHIGGLIDAAFVKKSVETSNTLNADIVVITGDLVDAEVQSVAKAVDELAHIESKFGTFFISGNHEYFHGMDETLKYLKKIGIRVLENEHEVIDGAFSLIGVHDLFGYRVDFNLPDLPKATKGLDESLPTLLLAHQPLFVDYLGDFKPNLMLSGHTHGGQIFPFHYLVKLQQPYLKGLHKMGENSYIYVNSGIGFWGPPMRLGSSAEISVIDWGVEA